MDNPTPSTSTTSQSARKRFILVTFRSGVYFGAHVFTSALDREDFTEDLRVSTRLTVYHLPEEGERMQEHQQADEARSATDAFRRLDVDSTIRSPLLEKLVRVHSLLGEEIQALDARMPREQRPLFEHLSLAAEAYAAEVKKRADSRPKSGPPLSLELVDGFRGMVVEAMKRLTERSSDGEATKEAFVLLGREQTVRSRNHWVAYEREYTRMNELRRALGVPELKTSLPSSGG